MKQMMTCYDGKISQAMSWVERQKQIKKVKSKKSTQIKSETVIRKMGYVNLYMPYGKYQKRKKLKK